MACELHVVRILFGMHYIYSGEEQSYRAHVMLDVCVYTHMYLYVQSVCKQLLVV